MLSASMVKLVDTRDLKSLAARCPGSTPGTRTIQLSKVSGELAEWLRQRFAKPSSRKGRIGSNPILSARITKRNNMAKTGPNFKLSKTSKRILCNFVDSHARGQWKRMMIDAEYSAGIVVRTNKKDKFTTGTPATE